MADLIYIRQISNSKTIRQDTSTMPDKPRDKRAYDGYYDEITTILTILT